MDIGLPLGSYYLLKDAFGADVITALIVSGLVPAARTIWTTLRAGKPDQFALAVLILTIVSIPITLLTGSPTFMLAKDGLGTATLGIYVGVMALRRQPVMTPPSSRSSPTASRRRRPGTTSRRTRRSSATCWCGRTWCGPSVLSSRWRCGC